MKENTTVGIEVRWPNVHFFDLEGPTVTKWKDRGDQTEDDGETGEVAADGYAHSAEEGT